MGSNTAEISLGVDNSDAKSKLSAVGNSLQKLGSSAVKTGLSIGKGIATGIGSAVALVGQAGAKIFSALGTQRFIDDMKKKTAELVNITDKIYGRVDRVKQYRESIRDLTKEQERNNEIAKVNPGLAMEMVDRNRELQIAIDNVKWSYRDLSEEDMKREEQLSVLSSRWQAVSETIADVGMKIMDSLIPAFDWIVGVVETSLVPAMGALATIWTNGWDIIQLAVVSAKLSIVKSFETLKYYFTEYLPYCIGYFRDNWKDVLKNVYDNVLQFCTNVGKNIKALWQAIKDYMSGKGWHFDGTALTEGLKPVLKDFKPPEREKSEKEKELEKEASDLSDKIVKGYQNNVTWVAEKFERNKTKAEEDRQGKTAPIGNAEREKLMLSTPKASTSDLVGAYMNIQTSVANRFQEKLVNKQIEAANRNADRQIAAIDRVAEKLDGQKQPLAVVAQG